MKAPFRRAIAALLLGVALYGVFVVYADYRKIAATLSTFHWASFLLALVLACANYLFRFLKWEYYLGRLEVRNVGKLDSLLIFLSGFVFTITPGKVGEVFKSAVLKRTYGVSASRTAPIVVAERLTDVIGVVALIVVGSAGFSGGLPWAGAGIVLVLLGMIAILWDRPGRAAIALLERSPRLARFAPKLESSHRSLRVLATPTALVWPTALSIAAWGCEGIALGVILHGFGIATPWALAAFFYATATLAGALIPVPGGLGVTETMIQTQLMGLGQVPAGPATSSMILVRIATLWWAVAVGFAAFAVLRRRFPNMLDDQAGGSALESA